MVTPSHPQRRLREGMFLPKGTEPWLKTAYSSKLLAFSRVQIIP